MNTPKTAFFSARMLRLPNLFPGIPGALLGGSILIMLAAASVNAHYGSAEAQIRPESADSSYTRVGLTLSGGGAKGFAHLGVLKVLEEVGMPIDYISATSMGALVGGLYAMGYSTDYIQKLSESLDWDDLFSDEQRRRHIPMEEKEWDNLYLLKLPLIDGGVGLPSGVVAGQRIKLLLSQLTWPHPGYQNFHEFPIPFTAIATDLETGRPLVMTEGFIAESIRASISIPSIFNPVQIDGQTLIDGGIVRNLPVEEVREMGADYVLAVNVSAPLLEAEELRSIVDILDQTITFQVSKNIAKSKEKADYVMEDKAIFDFPITDFDRAGEIIDLGEALAREHYDELEQLAAEFRAQRSTEPIYPLLPEQQNLIYISDIQVSGVKEGSPDQVKAKMMIREGTHVTFDAITLGIENVYAMQFYEKVSFRLVEDTDAARPHSYTLEVNVLETEQGMFGFGFNYDNYEGASILLNFDYRNFLYPSSVSRINTKLGEQPYVDVRFFNYITAESNIALNLRANYTLKTIDVFDSGGDRTNSYNTNIFFLQGLFIPSMTNQSMVSLGIRQEFFNISRRVGVLDFPGGASSVTEFIGRWDFDNLDRAMFPRRGHQLGLRASQTVSLLNTAVGFFQASADWRGNFQLSNPAVLQTRVFAGYATRAELPLHKQFRFGGYSDFVGFRSDEVASNNMRMIQAGLQYEVFPNRYISLMANAASTEELYDIDFKNNPVRIGWSLGLGINTMIAPFKVAVMGSRRSPLLVQYRVGMMF